ncbi:outer membrane beta-barrel protein [Bdellovibrio sp. HCB185ZH]|uniref:outer membrane beta-barrel protein n=1 Tax=Bdellovibrio sp. HCB185ZH TaxID=3394235 RepID=UPI0039A5AC8D
MQKYFISLVAALLFASSAQAALDYGLELGARQQNGYAYGPGISTHARTGLQAGAFVHMPLEGNIAHFRSGLLYTQRPLQTESDSGTKIDFNLDYLDIPITILFKPQEKFGIYLGFVASINIASSCSGDPNCKLSSIDTPSFPFIFGSTFKFNSRWGLDLYFDANNAAMAKGLADYKSVGLNVMFSLD